MITYQVSLRARKERIQNANRGLCALCFGRLIDPDGYRPILNRRDFLVFGNDILIYRRRIIGIHSSGAFPCILPNNIDRKSPQVDARSEADALFELRQSGTARSGHYRQPVGTKSADFIGVQGNEHGSGSQLSKKSNFLSEKEGSAIVSEARFLRLPLAGRPIFGWGWEVGRSPQPRCVFRPTPLGYMPCIRTH
jgi:hypothetical protein